MSKEREAFEDLQNQKIFKWFEFDSSLSAYVLKDISATFEKLTALAELNYGWDMWQAAKAQAVPEGFRLMPLKATKKMVEAAGDISEEDESWSFYDIYEAMVSSCEP